MTIGDLRVRIDAVCPITALVAYSLTDKTKWIVTFDPAATIAQRSLALAAITTAPALSPPNPPPPPAS